ncbi:hypothetical protein DENSPDRAFT_780348, partial [Dentipellis sp. KUC8613]
MSLAVDSKISVVPKLAADGSNWTTYKACTLAVLGAKGLMRHIMGAVRVPPATMPSPPEPRPAGKDSKAKGDGTDAGSSSPEQLVEPTDADWEAFEKQVEYWDEYFKRECMILAQLFATIPESLLIKFKD